MVSNRPMLAILKVAPTGCGIEALIGQAYIDPVGPPGPLAMAGLNRERPNLTCDKVSVAGEGAVSMSIEANKT